jgi:hypothetical protein
MIPAVVDELAKESRGRLAGEIRVFEVPAARDGDEI